MLTRLAAVQSRRLTALSRSFSDKKAPKGFEKFYRRKPGEEEKEEPKPTKEESPKPEEEPEESPKWSFSFQEFSEKLKEPMRLKLIVLGTCAMAAYYILSPSPTPPPVITYHQLIHSYLGSQAVKKIRVEVPKKTKNTPPLQEVYVIGKENTAVALLKVPSSANFLESFQQEQLKIGIEKRDFIPVEFQETHKKSGEEYAEGLAKGANYLINFTMLGSLIYFAFMLANRGKGSSSGGAGGFGSLFDMAKGNFKVYGVDSKKKITVAFKDVAGMHEAKREVIEFVEFLKTPQKFRRLGARIPRGALLVGPPGTGKTLLAKATAGEAGVPFFSISGSEFVEMFVGVGASRVRQLFKQAKERAPSIVFIDEIDAVGRKRHGRIGGNDEKDNTLNQLLVEMDGFATETNVVVLAGTNRKDILDPALLRPGRFDRIIEIALPDFTARTEILKVHLAPLKLQHELTIDEYARRLAALSPGFSGADLANLCNEAAIFAARKDKTAVDKDDFEAASERILGGLERAKKLNSKEKGIVAHHEAGHVVASWFLEGTDPVLKVSILPRSKGALGFAQFLPNETMLYSKDELLDKVCAILGGRVAEEIFFGEITTGAQDDLQKATGIAQALVTNFGMSEALGVIGYNVEPESFNKPFSQDTNRLIDLEVRAIIKNCLERTRILLSGKKELLKKLAQALLDRERLTHKELVEVLGERPFEAQDNYRKYVNES